MKPYTEQKSGNIIRRTFSHLVESEELVWHRDSEDRIVIPLNENDWMVQFDNELPKKLNVNEEFFIPKNTFHRVIKGSVDLMVEIIETKFEDDELVVYEAIEEGKKKKGKKDACYHKVRARYDVWPSAYGSGSLVQCRKVGAANWGNKTNENKEEFQNKALEKINKVGGFNNLPDIDKLALLGGTNDDKLKKLNLGKIFKQNGGTFGKLEIKVKVKSVNEQPINHKFSKEFAGEEGYLFPYINYTDDNEPYVTVRFDKFVSNLNSFGGGNYEERPIMLDNIYPIDYDEIKSEFVKYQNKIDFERDEFKKSFDDLENIEEKWSEKYKRSIDCNNPKGFSQRAHCQGRKKRNESIEDREKYSKEMIKKAHDAITRRKGKNYAPDVHELQAWIDNYLKINNIELDEVKKTDFSKEKEQGLHGWFSRKGGEGKSQGWVDCNTCRKDTKTGRKKCKSCGRKDGEERAKYPACRPTPSACGTPKKGESWGKKSNESLSMLENLSIFEPKNYIKNILRESFNQEDTMSEPMTQPAPVKPKEVPSEPFTEPVKPSRKNKPFLPMPNVQPDPKAEN